MITQNQQIQGSPEWLELRRSKLGASDAPVILGDSPWSTPYKLWEQKLGLVKPQETNWAMRRGTALEPVALQAYNDYTKNVSKPEVIFHSDIDYMMASLDGISEDRLTVVEIKCPGEKDHETACSGKVPEKYYAQLQHQIATSNTKMLHYFSFRNGEFKLIEVERDESYIKKLYKKEADFWKCLQTFEPPKLTDKDYALRHDNEWKMAVDGWKQIQEQLSSLKDLEKKYRNDLISLSDNANCTGFGMKVQKIIRTGSVDYSAIPELMDVDLDKYRKKPIESWRLTCAK